MSITFELLHHFENYNFSIILLFIRYSITISIKYKIIEIFNYSNYLTKHLDFELLVYCAKFGFVNIEYFNIKLAKIECTLYNSRIQIDSNILYFRLIFDAKKMYDFAISEKLIITLQQGAI